MMEKIKTKFLTKTEESGRFVIYSPRTGISYYVEPLSKGARVQWGDVMGDSIHGAYGKKHIGSVPSADSLITEENGFKNIVELGPGVSPNKTIEDIDEQRYAEGFRPKSEKDHEVSFNQ